MFLPCLLVNQRNEASLAEAKQWTTVSSIASSYFESHLRHRKEEETRARARRFSSHHLLGTFVLGLVTRTFAALRCFFSSVNDAIGNADRWQRNARGSVSIKIVSHRFGFACWPCSNGLARSIVSGRCLILISRAVSRACDASSRAQFA